MLRIFVLERNTRPGLVLLALLVAALCEAVGISAVLPAVSMIAGGQDSTPTSAAGRFVVSLLQWIGLTPELETVLALVFGALVLKALIAFLALSYAGVSAAKVSIRMRQRMIDALFRADWRFYSGQESGKFASAISGEATRAGEAYLLAAQFTALMIQTAIYIAVTLLIDWRLAALGVGVGILMARSLRFLIVMSKKAGYRQTDATKDLTVQTVQLLGNIKPLKTMQRYESFQMSIGKAMRRLQRALARREISKQLLTQLSDVAMALALIAVIYVSFTYFRVSLAALLVSGLLFMQVVGNITKLQKLLQQFAHAESAYNRVMQIITLTEENRELAKGQLLPDTGADFRFEHVTFAYEKEPVLRDVNLTVGARQITVLKGLSGSGKTTLIDLLVGLHTPQAGRVTLGNIAITDLDIKALRKRIGYVSQELSLLHATVRENICLGDTTIAEVQLEEALRLSGLEHFIDDLPGGLETSVGELGARLSGGQRQRIALARALVTRPDILILDEVTSALDPATEAGIVSNIRNLAKAFTIIVITHRDAWVEVADRLYEVKDGQVTEVGRTLG